MYIDCAKYLWSSQSFMLEVFRIGNYRFVSRECRHKYIVEVAEML